MGASFSDWFSSKFSIWIFGLVLDMDLGKGGDEVLDKGG